MSDITNAIKQICEEKNLSYKAVLETIESALAAAYRKDFGEKNQNIKVEFDPETAKSKVFDVKTVVDDMPEEEIVESEKLKVKSEAETKEEKKSGDDEVKKAESDVVAGVERKKLSALGGEVRSKKEKKKEADAAISSKAEAEKEREEGGEKKAENTNLTPLETSPSPLLRKGGHRVSPAAAFEAGQEEEVRKFNPKTELQIKDAKLIKKTAKVGDIIKTKLPVPSGYGRMAAQTAKQVIIQKLREAEREMIFSEFKNKEHEVVAGVVQRREGRIVLVDLGKAVGVLPAEEQIMGERYRLGDRLKVYVKYVGVTPRGPEILLSRTSEEILRKVFYLEIPEISNGLVEIKAVAREAGKRSKVAVAATGENVDPIGSCVGQRGSRIQTIISELGGEKIDIIEYDEDIAKFIAHALAPARVLTVELNQAEKRAVVKVVEDQLSLAIGREGQNVRLAAMLTCWKLDIVGEKAEKESKQTADGGKRNENKAEEAAAKINIEKPAPEAEAKKNEKIETEVVPANAFAPASTDRPAEVKTEPAAEKPKKEKKSKKKEKTG